MSILARTLSIIATLTTLPSLALAHEFWLSPSTLVTKPGELVSFTLRVGDHFPDGDIVPRNDSKIESFEGFGPAGKNPVHGKDGADIAGVARFAEPGTYVIAYRSKPSTTDVKPEVFEAYLDSKGIDAIKAMRAKAGLTTSPAKEFFSRAAKAVIQVGDQAAAGFDRSCGLRYEITPLTDPTTIRQGQALRVRMEFEGKPIASALVIARDGDAPTQRFSMRTDDKGIAELVIPRAGRWLIDSVYMIAAGPESGAQFESIWASLLLDVRDENGTIIAAPADNQADTKPATEGSPSATKPAPMTLPNSIDPIPVDPPGVMPTKK